MKGDAIVEPIAALYELTRRHPAVFATRIMPELLSNVGTPESLFWLHKVGLKAWTKLDAKEQEIWRYFVGHMKGVDSRAEPAKCFSIEDMALGTIQVRRAFTEKKYRKMTVKKAIGLVGEHMRVSPPLAKEVEAEIKRVALLAYRSGYLLIAVAPDLAVDDADRLMTKVWNSHRAEKGIVKQRARWREWLAIIGKFEDEVTSSNAYPPSLTRYRRIFDNIPFPSVLDLFVSGREQKGTAASSKGDW